MPPVAAPGRVNRRRGDQVAVVVLDHLAGADQVTGPGLAAAQQRMTLADRRGGQDPRGLPPGRHPVQADPRDAVITASGPRGLRQRPKLADQRPPRGQALDGRVILRRVRVQVEVDADHVLRQAQRDVPARIGPDPAADLLGAGHRRVRAGPPLRRRPLLARRQRQRRVPGCEVCPRRAGVQPGRQAARPPRRP